MIQSHLYARLTETPVFEKPMDDGKPSRLLHKGNWLGVMERMGEWIHVIGIQFEGWVRAMDVEERNPMNLHINYVPGREVEYISS